MGNADSRAGQLDDVSFHVFAMKEPDYVMSLMSTYGTSSWEGFKETQHDWKECGTTKMKTFVYPEVVHNHFQNHHAIDDHNTKRHSPISIEVMWAMKHWPNHVFAFLLSITEVNCFLAESCFTSRKSDSMMEFRKALAHQLIENCFLEQESRGEQ